MQEILCPQCSVVNLPSATECRQCHRPFDNLPPSAFITDKFSLPNPAYQMPLSADIKTGSRTYFWYRMYCAALSVLYVSIAVIGVVAMIGSYGNVEKPQDAFTGGVFLLILGAVLAAIFLAGIILSPKPASWILGIVLIALGMTSVCFLPFTLPLLFFWLKPETQTYFGRRK